MTSAPKPRSFAHHALAVLSAVMLVSTILTLVLTCILVAEAGDKLPGTTWAITMATAIWIGAFIIALPGAGMVLSLLWPVTRRGTGPSNAICLLAGATTGIILAPLASPRMQGASLKQLVLFAAIGIAVSAAYLIMMGRLAREPGAKTAPQTSNADQLALDL